MSGFSFTYYQNSGEKQAAADDTRSVCRQVLREIYEENPDYWPHGLSMDQLDGGVYLVHERGTDKVAGFVGWQERPQGLRKVGYYAVGLLKEFRGRSLAKQAVQQLLAEKAAGVDEVRALIVESNGPSRRLAAALDIPVDLVKYAGVWNKVRPAVAPLLTAGSNAAMWDSVFYSPDGVPFRGIGQDGSHARIPMALLNASVGGIAARPGISMFKRMAMIGTSPVKDLVVTGGETLKPLRRALDSSVGTSNKTLAGLAAIAAAAGLGAYGINRAIKNRADAPNHGKIRIRLPRPDGNETELELPLTQVTQLPEPVLRGLERDTRRRLREGVRQRTWRRGDGKMLRPYEGGDIDGDGIPDDDAKTAFFVSQRDSGRTDRMAEGFRNRVNEQRERLQNGLAERKQREMDMNAARQAQAQKLQELEAKRPAPKPETPAAPVNNGLRTLGTFVRSVNKRLTRA